MGRRPKRAFIKPQRLCIFCLGTPTTKEHIWSQWMHDLLPESPLGFTKLQRDWGRTDWRALRRGQGSVKTQTLKVVCGTCNSGWMRDWEDRVAPILTPLIKGQPILLGEDQQRTVATWLAMKAMVIEQGDPSVSVITWDERVAFCEREEMPASLKIKIAMCGLGIWESRFEHAPMFVALPSTPASKPASPNVQVTTIGIGMLLAHISVSRVNWFDLDNRVRINENVFSLWPLSGQPLYWPSKFRITEAAANVLAGRLDTLATLPTTRILNT